MSSPSKETRVTAVVMDASVQQFIASETQRYRKIIADLERENMSLKRHAASMEHDVCNCDVQLVYLV